MHSQHRAKSEGRSSARDRVLAVRVNAAVAGVEGYPLLAACQHQFVARSELVAHSYIAGPPQYGSALLCSLQGALPKHSKSAEHEKVQRLGLVFTV